MHLYCIRDRVVETSEASMSPMTTFTLDTNCLIDLEEGRAGAESVTELVEAHRTGIADVAVATVTASERQKDGGFLEN